MHTEDTERSTVSTEATRTEQAWQSLLKPEHLQLLVRVALCDENARIRAGASSMVIRIMGTAGEAAVKTALKQFSLSGSKLIRERAQCLLQS